MECRWWVEVSAWLDGELAEERRAPVEAHVRRCATCSAGCHDLVSLPVLTPLSVVAESPSVDLDPRERRWLHGRRGRWGLSVLAAAIVVWALVGFVGASAEGASGHAARHLATWQLGFGVGLIVAAAWSRLSQAMLALATTVALFTVIATVWDVMTGHRGPWAEWVHLVEIAAVGLLWWLTPPHLVLWRPDTERSRGRALRRARRGSV